jgi:hypothetical protein
MPTGKSKSAVKLTKSMLDKMSLKSLTKLAKKYKISVVKKGSVKLVKKSTLLKRLKASKSIKKILMSASKMKKTKFGESNNFVGKPPLTTPIEIANGSTYAHQLKHYKKIPSSLISFNMPKNLKYNAGELLPSSAPYGLVSKFGQYFH